SNYASAAAMTVLEDRANEDQPWVQATTVPAVVVTLDTTNSGWRTSWDPIVAGDFVGNGRQQVLLYDRAAGQADVVGFIGTGNPDRVYIGHNDFNTSPKAGTAAPPAGFGPITVASRSPGGGQNAPSIRPVIHSSGRIYAAYYN